MDLSKFNFTVVGLGLIGGSLAKGLKALGANKIFGIDNNSSALKAAIAEGIIDDDFHTPQEKLSQSDIVFIALYPEDTIRFVEENMIFFKANSIITDTCGIKKSIVAKINSILREDLNFIGGHPMAGKEQSGYAAAEKEIFYESNYFITPTGSEPSEVIDLMKNLITALGCSRVITMSPERHDEIIAYTSHLPHIIAVSLINCLQTDEELRSLIGGSFRDVTRVADINAKLWIELISTNRQNFLDKLNCFIVNLENIKRSIENGDKDYLLAQFETASIRRKEI